MLRLTVLLLMLLNVGYFAWSEGWLRAYGWAPVQQREPERLALQVNPQALTVLTESGALSATAAASATTSATGAAVAMRCLQSNELDAEQADVLRPLLQAQFAPADWRLDERLPQPHWMVYMGKFDNKADQAKKRAQLVELKLKFDVVEIAELAPGLSLGVYASQRAANDALTALSRRGVRTAKVVQVQDAAASYRLQLQTSDTAAASVQALSAALPTLALTPCAEPQER